LRVPFHIYLRAGIPFGNALPSQAKGAGGFSSVARSYFPVLLVQPAD